MLFRQRDARGSPFSLLLSKCVYSLSSRQRTRDALAERVPCTDPYERASRIRHLPRVRDGEACLRPGMQDIRFGAPGVGEPRDPLPPHAVLLTAAPEHVVAEFADEEAKGGERRNVCRHRVVAKVSGDRLRRPPHDLVFGLSPSTLCQPPGAHWVRFVIRSRDSLATKPRLSTENIDRESVAALAMFCHLALAFRPTSIKRRIASERVTSSRAASSSTAARVFGGNRQGILPAYRLPFGRPRNFLCTFFSFLGTDFRVCKNGAVSKSRKLLPTANPSHGGTHGPG